MGEINLFHRDSLGERKPHPRSYNHPMPLKPPWKWIARAAVIPAAVVAFVVVTGVAGVSPASKGILDAIRGRHEPMTLPPGAAKTIDGLQGFSLEGEPVELVTLRGKPIVFEVWATWCPPCRTQRAIFEKMGDDLTGRAAVVGLSVDTNPHLVTQHLQRHPSNLLELMAPPETIAAFGGVSAVPTLVFVDAEGALRGVGVGVHSASVLRARLDELAVFTTK